MLGADYITTLQCRAETWNFINKDSEQTQKTEAERCEYCGSITEERIAGRAICSDCTVEMGSCCPEFGHADLT